MKTDWYLKIVLTVIAIALVVIVIRDISFTPTATAQTTTSSLPRVIDVNIVSVSGRTLFNGLDVNIKDEVAIKVPYDGLKVKVANYRDFN